MMNCIIIIGASGHGKVVADIAKHIGYEQIFFLDDDKSKLSIGKYEVIGPVDKICELLEEQADTDVFVAIGNNQIRQRILQKLPNPSPTLIHHSAVIDESASIGAGCVVMAGAVINADAKIGDGCIVNTGATIDHDCVIGDYTHISPGAHIAGTVSIGSCCWLGIGSAVVNNVSIADNSIIGAGGVVINDITEPGTYVGCPVMKVK